MHISANNFKAAARIAEEIESLQKQLDELLQNGLEAGSPPERVAAPRQKLLPSEKLVPRPRRGDIKGRGTLRPAVHEVLARSKTPLNAGAIYDALVANKYRFSFSEPRKILRIRLYKMAGIQPLGGGLFKLKDRI